MAEKYIGTKFKTIFLANHPANDGKINALISWCKKFHANDLSQLHNGLSSGNLSCRSQNGFLVSATGKNYAKIAADEIVEVVDCDLAKKIVKVSGSKEPSSESMAHWFIYNKFPEITAIFHGHNGAILAAAKKLGLPVTKNESPYGTKKEIAEVSKILGKGNFLILKGHGFLSLGRSMEEAGSQALKLLKSCKP